MPKLNRQAIEFYKEENERIKRLTDVISQKEGKINRRQTVMRAIALLEKEYSNAG